MSHTKKARKAEVAPQKKHPKRSPPEAVPQSKPDEISTFAVGERVSHAQFGGGTITVIEDHKLSIKFDSQGNKQIIDSYLKHQKK